MTNSRIRIAILDTGISWQQMQNKGSFDCSQSVAFHERWGTTIIKKNITDEIGHGTAVAEILVQEIPDAVLIPIKMMEKGHLATDSVLVKALSYILDNVSCDLINISLGLTCSDNLPALRNVCSALVQRGTMIIAAFDNGGSLSYPAALQDVFGIDSLRGIPYGHYYATEDDEVNYIVPAREIHTKWLHGACMTVSGNSFEAPYFCKIIADARKCVDKYDLQTLKHWLDTQAVKKVRYKHLDIPAYSLTPGHAVVFPVNKETSVLARNRTVLPFTVDFYDMRYSGMIGHPITDKTEDQHILVRNIDQLDWEGPFDTVILGHVSLLEWACHRNLTTEIIEKCRKYQKQLYSFHDIRSAIDVQSGAISYYAPYVEKLPAEGLYKKTAEIGRPVLGIVGTGSKQGKFSLQVALIQELKKRGLNIGYLGTEPSAALFGADCVYPFGFESSVAVSGLEAIYTINQMMKQIERKNPDIILFGSQSQTIPNDCGGLRQFTPGQSELLQACAADAYILCVSPDDSLEYISRTVRYLESLTCAKVLALALSPIQKKYRWSVLGQETQKLTEADKRRFKMKLFFSRYPLIDWSASVQSLSRLCNIVVRYFS